MFFYEQNIGGFWTVMPCAGGTIYSDKECQCVTDNRINVIVPGKDNDLIHLRPYLGLIATKSVFGVSDKVRFKPACSATETS